jgi:hypothetical protein
MLNFIILVALSNEANRTGFFALKVDAEPVPRTEHF